MMSFCSDFTHGFSLICSYICDTLPNEIFLFGSVIMKKMIIAISVMILIFSVFMVSYADDWLDQGIMITDSYYDDGGYSAKSMSESDIVREHVLVSKTISTSGIHDFNYILYKPSNDRDLSGLPLIVVLHGSGERGRDFDKLYKRAPYIQLKNGTVAPKALVLMPQLPSGSWGDRASDVMELIRYICDTYSCDMNRISITGHSLGGCGTLDMLIKYPGFFSAAAPVSASVGGRHLSSIVETPVWIFHGTKDYTMGFSIYDAYDIINGAGGYCRLTKLEGEKHQINHVWYDKEYALFDWMLSRSKDEIIIVD